MVTMYIPDSWSWHVTYTYITHSYKSTKQKICLVKVLSLGNQSETIMLGTAVYTVTASATTMSNIQPPPTNTWIMSIPSMDTVLH